MKFQVVVAAAVVAFFSLWSSANAQSAPDIIHNKTLPNGLEVVVMPSSTVPIVTIEIAVKNGAFTETPEFDGLSHLYEHMFFKGNAVIPNQEAYLARMRELGMVFNGTTSDERVNYFFTLPADNLEAGLIFMKDAITSPTFDEEEFQKEIQVVLGEVDRSEASPYYAWWRAVDAAVWHTYPSRKNALGDRETITTATVDKMKVMQERYYVPNNSALFISGDVEVERAFELAEQVYGGWARGADPFVKHPVPEHPPLKSNSYIVVDGKVQVPAIQFVWHGPSVGDDPRATFAADVLSYILVQPASAFQKALVDSGITLSAGLSYYTQRFTGPISLGATATPDKLEAAVGALLTELEKVTLPGYFTDEQLESAKTILAIEDLFARESMSSFTHTVSFWWAVAGLDYYRGYIDSLKAVTRADITAYVTKYIIGKPFVVAAIVPTDSPLAASFDAKRLESLVTQVGAHAEDAP